MRFPRVLEMLLHFPRRAAREAVRLCLLLQFWLYNRLGSKAVTQPGSPVVSLTTWGKRATTVYLAIESIAAGRVRPSRLILWIDDERVFRNLPTTLRRLQARGLEVKLCANYRPHKKYYPYLESECEFETPLVTADDDMLYPRSWLKALWEANRKHPLDINCFWGHEIALSEEQIAPVSKWKPLGSQKPSFLHAAAGGTGAIYPPPFLGALKRAGTGFEDCCPKDDDLWLHVQAVRAGFRVRAIVPRLPYLAFVEIPGTYGTALCRENFDKGESNGSIARLYQPSDINILQGEIEGR